MVDDLFYLVTRKSFGQPLVEAFLVGEYCGGTQSRYFREEIPPHEVALVSKNVARIPKVFGRHCWIVPAQLQAALSPWIVAKWREVKIAQPFMVETSFTDGFQLLDELHRKQMSECLAAGKSKHQCAMELTTDPDLAYLEFVKRFAVNDFQSPDLYFELIAENSTSRAKREKDSDLVAIDHAFSPPVFSRLTAGSERFFSLASLESCGLISLGYGCHALTHKVFEVIRPFLEPDLYTIVVNDKTSIKELLL